MAKRTEGMTLVHLSCAGFTVLQWKACWMFQHVSVFMLGCVFQHDCLDTCCSERLIFMCFAFLYLHLFSMIEQVSNESHSRNTLIIIIITNIIIIKVYS